MKKNMVSKKKPRETKSILPNSNPSLTMFAA